jgi:glycosyltransferase involved in cell wall biosynthesis
MRIWILNHYASPPDRPGGTRHYEFGRVLAEQGHEITIFASSFSHFSRKEERLAPGERMRVEWVDGVRFVWIRTTPYSRNDLRRVGNMFSYAVGVVLAQRRLSRPGVVVGSSVHLAAVAAAWLIGRLRRAPFVFEVRDLWPQTLIDMEALREHSAAAAVLRAVEGFLYRRARVVISLLPDAAEYIAGRGIARDKIAYIPNGIADTCSGDQPASSQAEELVERIEEWRRSGRIVVGYVGSHGRANGIGTLVEAARELRDCGEEDIAFAFVGEGPERAACERLAREYDLANVMFWPPVPKQSVRAVLGALDVTLFSLRDVPVFKYGLSSNKLFDYLASGRPVVAACAAARNPVSESGGGICVPPESPKAVADALIEMAALGGAGRRALGQRGRQWVSEHHSATVLAGQFLQALTTAQR